LAQVQEEFANHRGLQLVEANEQLVLAAMRAQAAAQDAASRFDELNALGQHDELTGLPNRSLMLDRLTTVLAVARRHGSRAAVMFIDLDEFKPVNDRLGHAVGDEVLRVAAQRLRSALRDSDTVSRFGGDEFLVLLTDLKHPNDATHIADKILLALAADGRVHERELTLAASVGIALYPEDGYDAATLIARADSAMYQAKRQGGARHRLAADPLALPAAGTASGHAAVNASDAAHTDVLREANERLVIAAIHAEERHDEATQAQLRHVQFLAMVAHELRNPLHPIRTAAELLGRVASGDAQLLRVETIIKNQVAHLARLVEDLLDGSRVSAGKFRLHLGHVDLAAVLRAAFDTCEAAVGARKQQFSLHLPSGLLAVRGDAQRLTQVFSNLLDNASKYTPSGGRIKMSLSRQAGGLAVSVSDTGAGITTDALPRIFDLFVQDERVEALDVGGLGIGLAVVRDLVEGHGGSVTAASAGRGLGSEFVVWLPAEHEAIVEPA
jgi:diguanylate cyclase (GGDEF)-like protein